MLPKRSVRGLPVYQPGKPIEDVKREYGLKHVIKLASNENPFGCSPFVLENILPDTKKIALYPDGAARDLRDSVAKHLNVQPEQLIFGNGSDEIVQHIARCFLEPGTKTVMADVTFPRYKTNAQIEGTEVVEVPLKNGTHDLSKMADAVDGRTRVVWVCNPNNPTGTIVSHKEVATFLTRIPSSVLVVLDEAYYEYVNDSSYPDSLALLKEHPNVIVLRTFSKIYGLAALRVGYGIAAPDVITELNRVREPFNVNTLAQRGARLALEDQTYIRECRERNLAGRKQLTDAFDRLGLNYYPPHGNFVFVETGVPAPHIFRHLLKKGVIVRIDESWNHPTALRVTIGSEEENRAFLNALEQLLRERGRVPVS